jgi:CDP-diacylglycerol pyrophosphatase
MANVAKLFGGALLADVFRRNAELFATGLLTTGFVALFVDDSVAAPELWRFRPPLQTSSTSYDGLREQVWDTAQNCAQHASKQTVDTWQFNCYVPKYAFEAGNKDYQNRLIFYWDGDKKQVLLVPVDYISGVEANQFFGGNVLLPDYWNNAIDALDGPLRKNPPLSAPSGGGYGIAMNSANFRTRDQLHLHICTVEKDVIDKINAAKPTENFTQIRFKTNGHVWWIRKFTKGDNVWARTFLSSVGHANTDDKANVSIAVIEKDQNNYWLLYNQRGRPDTNEGGAGAETLLQDKCNNPAAPK